MPTSDDYTGFSLGAVEITGINKGESVLWTPDAPSDPVITPPATPVFAWDFEEGNFSAWTSETDSGGKLAVDAGAKLQGTHGARIAVTSSVNAYLEKQALVFGTTLRMEQSVRLSSDYAHGSFEQFRFIKLLTNTTERLAVGIRPSGALSLIRSHVFSSVVTTATLTKGKWHKIGLVVTGLGTNAMTTSLLLDGVQVQSQGSADWTGVTVNRLRLGYQTDQTPGAFAGYVDFDDGWLDDA